MSRPGRLKRVALCLVAVLWLAVVILCYFQVFEPSEQIDKVLGRTVEFATLVVFLCFYLFVPPDE